MSRTWIVRDPLGFEHRVVIEGVQAYGFENLAHHLPRGERDAMNVAVLTALHLNRPLPQGYTYEMA